MRRLAIFPGAMWGHAITFVHAVLSIALTYVVADSHSPWIQSLPGFSYALIGVSRGVLGAYIGRQQRQLAQS